MAQPGIVVHCGLGGVSAARCRIGARAASLEQCIAAAPQGGDVTLLLDSRDLLLTHVALPTRRARTARAAAPYAVEDQLAADVDTQQIYLGPRQDSGFPVAVVSRARLENLLEELERLGLAVDRVVPDVLALPWQEGSWSLGEVGDALLVRTGPAAGFSCDVASADAVLGAALSAATAVPTMLALGRFRTLDCGQLFNARGIRLVRQDEQRDLPDLMQFTAAGIDLLPAAMRRQQPTRTPWLRTAALLAGVTALLHLANLYLDRRALDVRAETLRGAIESSLLAVAPPGTPVRDPLQQLSGLAQRIERGPRRFDLLPLLADVTAALAQVSGEGLTLSALNYEHGETEFTLTAGSAGQVERLARSINQQGNYRAQVLSASTTGGVTEARLLVNLP